MDWYRLDVSLIIDTELAVMYCLVVKGRLNLYATNLHLLPNHLIIYGAWSLSYPITKLPAKLVVYGCIH